MRKLASRIIMLILIVSALITSASASYEYDKATGHATISGSLNTITEKAYSYWYHYVTNTNKSIHKQRHSCEFFGGSSGVSVIEEIYLVTGPNGQAESVGNVLGISSNEEIGIYQPIFDDQARSHQAKDVSYFQLNGQFLDQGLNIARRETRPYRYADSTPVRKEGTLDYYTYSIGVMCSNCGAGLSSLSNINIAEDPYTSRTTQRSTDEVYLQPTTSPKSFTLKNVSTRNLAIKTDVPVTIDGGTYSGAPAA